MSCEKYDFNLNTIYREMLYLLSGQEENLTPFGGDLDFSAFYKLNTTEKIDLVNECLKKFIIGKLKQYVKELDYAELETKKIPELVKILAKYVSNPEDLWPLCHYLLGMISDLKGTVYTIWGEDEDKLKDNILLDLDKKEIHIHLSTGPIEVFNMVHEYLFCPDFIDRGQVLERISLPN